MAGWLPRLIEQPPEEQGRAVSLYELEGLSPQEIATREAISLSGPNPGFSADVGGWRRCCATAAGLSWIGVGT